jgi:hypothetical protein
MTKKQKEMLRRISQAFAEDESVCGCGEPDTMDECRRESRESLRLIRAEMTRLWDLEARLDTFLFPTGKVARGTAGEVSVVDVAGDGTGPWKLFLGHYGVAMWPSTPADEEPKEYALSVANVISRALADKTNGPRAKMTKGSKW